MENKFEKGKMTKNVYEVIMHDLECLEFERTESNNYHYCLLKQNLEDIFGVR